MMNCFDLQKFRRDTALGEIPSPLKKFTWMLAPVRLQFLLNVSVGKIDTLMEFRDAPPPFHLPYCTRINFNHPKRPGFIIHPDMSS